MMKIVFLCRLFYPHIGGVEKHVMEISKRLIDKGHDVTVITEELDSRFHGNDKKKEEINGITIYRISVGKDDKFKKIRIWREMSHLQSVIKDADIIHCHDVFFWYLPFRFLYPQKSVYTTFHGYESYPIKKSAIRIRKFSEKLSWGNICIGDFIPKWYGTKASFVSYGAVDSTKFKVQNAKFKKESAVFIGRLDEQTGVLTYAKAVKILKKKFPKFDLTVIGDGEDRKKIEKQFTVLGFKKNPEKYFQNYHFAFVSRYLSILEAFAAKRLVFAVYDNPVKKDYLRLAPYAKFIIIEKDPEILAEKIAYYFHHPKEEKEKIEKAFAWVSKQTWEKLTTTYLNLWSKNLKRRE